MLLNKTLMFEIKKVRVWLVVISICLLPKLSQAIQIGENIEVHGFAALAYVNSNHNPFYGDTQDGSFDFQEAALNGFWEINDSWRLSGQVLYHNTGNIAQDNTNIDFLMLDFKFMEQEFNTMGIRIGRVKVPYGLYNSSRDVPHGRPAIFVPRSIYFESFRDAIISVDGGAWYGNNYSDWGSLDYQFFAGHSKMENNSMEHYLFSKNIMGKFEETDLKGFQFMYVPEMMSNIKLGYSLLNVKTGLKNGSKSTAAGLATDFATQYLFENAINPISPSMEELGMAQLYAQEQLNNELKNNFVHHLQDVKLNAYMHVLSLQYFWENFTFTGEYLRIHSDLEINIADIGGNTSHVTSEAFYTQVEWQALDKLVLLARYEEFYNNTNDRNGSKTFDAGFSVTPLTNYAKGYTLGARWYFNTDTSLTFEYSSNRGVSWLPKDDDINAVELEEKWDYFALQLSYHF